MALPKIDTPIYELVLPVSKKKISFRPFLVKEQKILLMSKEANDKDSIVRAIKQVLKNCTISDISIESLPIVDIEYYFLNLRARSVGEVVDMKYKCENENAEGTVCGNTLDISINLLDIKLKNIENYSDTIMITTDVGIKFKHPDFSLFEAFDEKEEYVDMVLNVIVNSIEYIFEGEVLHYAKDSTKEEIVQFLDSLTQQQFESIESHFKNLPVLEKNVLINCSKCNYEHNIQIEGIDNFFV